VSNPAKAQGTLVDPLSPQPLSHVSLDYVRSSASAIPHNRVLEPSLGLGHRDVLAATCFPMLGPAGPALNPAWPSLRLSCRSEALISPSLSILAVLLTPVSVLAGALGAWRLAADPGWTSQFFIASGLLSHCQVWFALAIAVRASSCGLNHWLEIQNSKDRQ